MLREVLLQVGIALHRYYVIFQIYKLVFVFPLREMHYSNDFLLCRDDERTLTTSC